MVTWFSLVTGTPIGIMAGIYLAEFSEGSLLGKVTRFMNDILSYQPPQLLSVYLSLR